MRFMAISALAISLLATALIAQTAPRATAPAGAANDPMALHRTIDMRTLPEQHSSDPF